VVCRIRSSGYLCAPNSTDLVALSFHQVLTVVLVVISSLGLIQQTKKRTTELHFSTVFQLLMGVMISGLTNQRLSIKWIPQSVNAFHY
jgi:hypothetical protein